MKWMNEWIYFSFLVLAWVESSKLSFLGLHSVPLCATLCHSVPLCATLCHSVPLCATLCHSVPLCATPSYYLCLIITEVSMCDQSSWDFWPRLCDNCYVCIINVFYTKTVLCVVCWMSIPFDIVWNVTIHEFWLWHGCVGTLQRSSDISKGKWRVERSGSSIQMTFWSTILWPFMAQEDKSVEAKGFLLEVGSWKRSNPRRLFFWNVRRPFR
jgi:hypothetical protein